MRPTFPGGTRTLVGIDLFRVQIQDWKGACRLGQTLLDRLVSSFAPQDARDVCGVCNKKLTATCSTSFEPSSIFVIRVERHNWAGDHFATGRYNLDLPSNLDFLRWSLVGHPRATQANIEVRKLQVRPRKTNIVLRISMTLKPGNREMGPEVRKPRNGAYKKMGLKRCFCKC